MACVSLLLVLLLLFSCGEDQETARRMAVARSMGQFYADHGRDLDLKEYPERIKHYEGRLRERMGTPILVVRDFLRSNVAPNLEPNGAWDADVADQFQVAVLALQMHPVWGEGCEDRWDHREGVYTHGFGAHLRGLIAQFPGEQGPEELGRVLDALDALGLQEPSHGYLMLGGAQLTRPLIDTSTPALLPTFSRWRQTPAGKAWAENSSTRKWVWPKTFPPMETARVLGRYPLAVAAESPDESGALALSTHDAEGRCMTCGDTIPAGGVCFDFGDEHACSAPCRHRRIAEWLINLGPRSSSATAE